MAPSPTCAEYDPEVLRQERDDAVAALATAVAATADALHSAKELWDKYTAFHERGVSRIALELCRKLQLSPAQCEGVRIGALIHDAGKLAVPLPVLNKTTPLTPAEVAVIREHPQAGHDIIKSVASPWPLAAMVLQHHERLDGSGYPRGLTGEDILLEARVIAVADVAHAMLFDRPYRSGRSGEAGQEELRRGRGRLYDPEVADACISLIADLGVAGMARLNGDG